jgi:hypothetical protein
MMTCGVEVPELLPDPIFYTVVTVVDPSGALYQDAFVTVDGLNLAASLDVRSGKTVLIDLPETPFEFLGTQVEDDDISEFTNSVGTGTGWQLPNRKYKLGHRLVETSELKRLFTDAMLEEMTVDIDSLGFKVRNTIKLKSIREKNGHPWAYFSGNWAFELAEEKLAGSAEIALHIPSGLISALKLNISGMPRFQSAIPKSAAALLKNPRASRSLM